MLRSLRWPLALLSLLALAFVPLTRGEPAKWTKEIDAYTAADAKSAPAKNGIVFVGSSSIRRWTTLAADFPGLPVLNRGFGGSELADSVFYADRIVIPYAPRLVVVYAGENDLWLGKTPEAVLADFRAFRTKVHAALPQTKIFFLAIKESPSRVKIRDHVLRANALVALDCATDPRCRVVDVATPLLDATGQTRPELFIQDQLHLNAAGYAIWTKVLAPLLK